MRPEPYGAPSVPVAPERRRAYREWIEKCDGIPVAEQERRMLARTSWWPDDWFPA